MSLSTDDISTAGMFCILNKSLNDVFINI
jgi:hypothetical protein